MTSDSAWRAGCVVAYLDEPPFFAPVSGAEPTGCDIELTKMVLDEIEVAAVEYVLTSFGELIDGIESGRWDINTPMFVTDERAKRLRFSRPVWAAIDSFIVRTDDRRDFSSYEAIASDPTIRLAAVAGQIQLDTALTAGIPSEQIARFFDQDTAASAVLAGQVDASVSTAPGNAAYVERLGDARLASVVDEGAGGRGGLALGAFSFRRDSDGLADAFDAALGRILGTDAHLTMMGRYGFDRAALAPALNAARH